MILSKTGDWIKELFSNFEEWLKAFTKFDERVLDFYTTVIAPLSEWIKIVGLLFVAIILIFGIFSLIKKAYKLVIVVAVIYALFVGLSHLMS